MNARNLVPLLISSALFVPACDGGDKKPEANVAADNKAKEDAELEARLEKRKQERLAEQAEKKRKEEELVKKIEEITVIPEDAELPKKAADACEQVVKAQEGFMKKFHGQIEDAALTTQLGMLRKQCNEMSDVKVAMCQKYALDATTEDLKKSINEYLPSCMKKYGGNGAE